MKVNRYFYKTIDKTKIIEYTIGGDVIAHRVSVPLLSLKRRDYICERLAALIKKAKLKSNNNGDRLFYPHLFLGNDKLLFAAANEKLC